MKSLLAMALLALSAVPAQAYQSWSTCYATTTCFNPYYRTFYQISCNVSADSSNGTACTWEVWAGRGVRCTGLGYDQYGNYGWMTSYANCM